MLETATEVSLSMSRWRIEAHLLRSFAFACSSTVRLGTLAPQSFDSLSRMFWGDNQRRLAHRITRSRHHEHVERPDEEVKQSTAS